MAKDEERTEYGDGGRRGGWVGAGLEVEGAQITHQMGEEIGGGGGQQLRPLCEAVDSGETERDDAESGCRGEETGEGSMAAMEEEHDWEEDQQVGFEQAEGKDSAGEDFVAVNEDEEDIGGEDGYEERVLAEAGAGDKGEEADHPDAEMRGGIEPDGELPDEQGPEGDVDGDEDGFGCGE